MRLYIIIFKFNLVVAVLILCGKICYIIKKGHTQVTIKHCKSPHTQL